ncbi:Uncharacterized protein C32A11.02c [Hypsizygus marmoreus]|uniref:Uncharacterized protein C32A11.02c n=1 Tax=Hypsizygus marmoreus TaxID=39966 RepID=A0A369JYS9_HYPMA|nr:Uncharacterized protein C32A11.02c [Hypsizygus marmoreus]
MGSCFSNLSRKRSDPEREPLLPKPVSPPPRARKSLLDRAVDIAAALQSGKLPSQNQLNLILRSIANSDILQCEAQLTSGPGPLSENGRRVLGDAREVVESLLQVGMEKNVDNKFQDMIYQCSQISGPPVRVEADAAIKAGQEGLAQIHAEAPTSDEITADTAKTINALKDVFRLLLTSAAFRLLLSDVFASARELLGQVAADVSDAALQVQVAAEGIERAANVEDGSIGILAGRVEEAVSGAVREMEQSSNETVVQESTRDIVVARFQELIVRAHKDPRTLSALRTLLHITRKYAGKLSRTANIVADAHIASTNDANGPAISVIPQDEVSQALQDLKILLERLAGGHSLDALLVSLSATANSLAENASPDSVSSQDVDLRQYLTSLDHFLDLALAPTPPTQPLYATSRAGTRALENLYDGGHILFVSSSASTSFSTSPRTPNTTWALHLRELLDSCDTYTSALSHDHSTMRLVRSLSKFHDDVAELIAMSFGFRAPNKLRIGAWKQEFIQDVFGWVLPRLMKLVGHISVPMPRVEYQSGSVEAALDALPLAGEEGPGVELDMSPDYILLRSWNELRVDMGASSPSGNLLLNPETDAPEARTSSSSRVQIHVDGVRFAVRDLGYFFRYKGRVLGYSDQGLLGVDVGLPSGKQRRSMLSRPSRKLRGLAVDIDLSLASMPGTPLVTVEDVRTSLPALHINVSRSKHYILNKLLIQPLAVPVAARVVRGVVEEQVRTALEWVICTFEVVQEEARRVRAERGEDGGEEGEFELGDWWDALLVKGPEIFGTGRSNEADGDGELDVETLTSTKATMKGIVHTTTTIPRSDAEDQVTEASASSSSPSSPLPPVQGQTETSIAVGGGAMLFPDKAGAYAGDDSSDPPVVDEVLEGVRGAVGNVEDVVESGVESAVRMRGEMEQAEERHEERMEVEGRRVGWRSRAFDF